MGLEVGYLDFMTKHIKNTFGHRNDLRMLELGDQVITPNDYYLFATGKEYFQSLGYYHTSVDINGLHGAEVRDLTKTDQFLDLHNQFDILTNAGTTEHVEPYESQFDCWKILHDCVKPYALFLHILPDVHEHDYNGQWRGHCSFYYSHDFFVTLSKACNYTLLESTVIRGHRVVALEKNQHSAFNISKELLLQGISIRY